MITLIRVGADLSKNKPALAASYGGGDRRGCARRLLGSSRVASGAEPCRDAVGRGRAADDLGLYVSTRIAFVGAQVGAVIIRQALEADETCLQRAHFAAWAGQSGEDLLGGVWGFGGLGHAALTHDSPDQATPKMKFPHKFQ